MVSWLDSEVDMWSFFMLHEQYPMYLTCLIVTVCKIYMSGTLPIDVLANGILALSARVFYKRVSTWKHKKQRFVLIFLYYQVIQLFHVFLALSNPRELVIYVISSTILLVHCEITPLLGTGVSMVLVGKHILVWNYCLWSVDGLVVSLDTCITVIWTFFHLWNYIVSKETALINGFHLLQEIRREQQKTEALLQAVPDGVLVLTQTQEVVTFNKTLLSMLKVPVSAADVPGQVIQTLTGLKYAADYQQLKKPGYHQLLEDIIASIQVNDEDTCVDFGSVLCENRYLEWRGTISKWNQLKVCIMTVRDVGEWVHMETLARQESAAKTALIRSISHELRTPINAIINISEQLLEKESLTSSGKEQCEILISSSGFLLNTASDLLDWSRMTNEQFKLNKQAFRLQEEINSCVKLIQPQCRLKRIAVGCRYDHSIPPTVYNDANRIKQVLINLLSNAVKFTLKGKIEVVVTLMARNWVKIAVKDTGIGISRENRGKLFSVCGKLEGRGELNPQGCGLGLHISHALVKNMGGSGISLVSTPGLGSEFSFTIPISPLYSPYIPRLERSLRVTEFDEVMNISALPEPKKIRREIQPKADILIVDDYEFNRLVLRTILDSLGLDTDEAYTGIDALRKLEHRDADNSPYRLIFMDIDMPEMNGIEATREVRKKLAEGKLRHSPTIVGCSAYVAAEDRESCLQAGMDLFLEKPVSKAALVALCQRLGYIS